MIKIGINEKVSLQLVNYQRTNSILLESLQAYAINLPRFVIMAVIMSQ